VNSHQLIITLPGIQFYTKATSKKTDINTNTFRSLRRKYKHRR